MVESVYGFLDPVTGGRPGKLLNQMELELLMNIIASGLKYRQLQPIVKGDGFYSSAFLQMEAMLSDGP